jgi:hypothetical protein
METTDAQPEVETVVELSQADLELIGGGMANFAFC